MSSLIVWMLAITISVVMLVLSASASAPIIHMAIAAVIALMLAGSGIIEVRSERSAGANDATIAAINARYMGLVWVWGAANLILTYKFVLYWREWMPFFLAFVSAAGLCLFFSATLKQDAARGTYDPMMKKIGRWLTIGQVVGMIIAAVGLIIDGKMTRYLNPRYTDWAANNIFFFGALALIAIGVHALLSAPTTEAGKPADNAERPAH